MSISVSRSEALTASHSALLESARVRQGAALVEWLAQVCVSGLIVVSILVPPISLNDDLPYVKAEQLLLPFILVVYGWLLLAGYARPIGLNGLVFFAAMFTLSILLSLWYGAAVLGHEILLRDYYEIPKVWLPVAFFTIAYGADLSERALRRLLGGFAAGISLVCLYGWAQFADLGFTYRLNPYYTGSGHIERAVEYAGRVYATMGNPNVLAQLLTWSVVVFVMAAFFRFGNLVWSIVLVFACLATLAVTGSRFGLLVCAIGLLMIAFIPMADRRRRALHIVLLIVLLPILGLMFQATANLNQSVLERFETLRNPLEVDSLRSRIDDLWRNAVDDFERSPVLGNGSAKVIYTGFVTDSEYLDVLKEFGIVGFVCYLGFYLFPLWLMGKGVRIGVRADPQLEQALPANFLVMRFGIILVVTSLVMNAAISTFYNEILQGFIWIWMGLACRAAITIRSGAAQFALSRSSLNPPFGG